MHSPRATTIARVDEGPALCARCEGTGHEPERPASFLTLVLPLRTVTESNAKGMWREKARRAKRQRALLYVALRARPVPPLPLVLAFTRIAPGRLDDDNLSSALKHCRDGVQDWLGIDDGDARLTWTYAQERGAPGEYGVRLEVRARQGWEAPSDPDPEPPSRARTRPVVAAGEVVPRGKGVRS